MCGRVSKLAAHHTESVRFAPTLNALSTAQVGRTDNRGSTNVRR
ncbi:hypothetical protein ACOS9P_003937 [Proteus mirabilis]